MVKTLHQCEICRERYASFEEAVACEERGPVEDQPCPPVGTLFIPYEDRDGCWVAVVVGPPDRSISLNGHYGYCPVWWYRANQYGDDDTELGKGRRDVSPVIGTTPFQAQEIPWESWGLPVLEHLDSPQVKRALARLREVNVVPQCVDHKTGKLVEIPE